MERRDSEVGTEDAIDSSASSDNIMTSVKRVCVCVCEPQEKCERDALCGIFKCNGK